MSRQADELGMLRSLQQDLIWALRSLRKDRVTTVAGVMCLALGIGANSAIFSVVDMLLLRNLPVRAPSDLFFLTIETPRSTIEDFSYPMYEDLRRLTRNYGELAAQYSTTMGLNAGSRVNRIKAQLVTGNYFSVLQLSMLRGRPILPEDDRISSHEPVAVISYKVWKKYFNFDAHVLQKSIRLDNLSYSIVGVTPPAFKGIEIDGATDIWIPMGMRRNVIADLATIDDRIARWFQIIGRLSTGKTVTTVEPSIAAQYRHLLPMEVSYMGWLSRDQRAEYLQQRLRLVPGEKGKSTLREKHTHALLLVTGLMSVVLLAACAAIATLFLMRATRRRKEAAIRLAMGAPLHRMFRQFLLESVVISLTAAVIAALIAPFGARFMTILFSREDPLLAIEITWNVRTFFFSAGLGFICASICGLIPARQWFRVDPALILKEQEGGPTPWRRYGMLDAIISLQTALCCIVVVVSLLLAKSVQNLSDINPGFNARHVLLMTVDVGIGGVTQATVNRFYEQTLDQIEAIPGIAAVSLARISVLSGEGRQNVISTAYHRAKSKTEPNVSVNLISRGYFRSLGITLIAGRDFTKQDVENTTKVAIINQAMAREFFPGMNAVGHRFAFGTRPPEGEGLQVIGVVRDAKYRSLREDVVPTIYLPLMQTRNVSEMTLQAHTLADANLFRRPIEQELRSIAPNVPVYGVRTMQEQIESSVRVERLLASLAAVFALFNLLLVAVGLHGVTWHSAANRMREVAIRLALGARPWQAVLLLMRRTVCAIIIGLSLGLVGALVIVRFLQSYVYGITASDPAFLVAAILMICAIACISTYLPANRATRVEVSSTLRTT